ncbi:pyridoxine biosynthesis protein [Thecaphora frezii]
MLPKPPGRAPPSRRLCLSISLSCPPPPPHPCLLGHRLALLAAPARFRSPTAPPSSSSTTTTAMASHHLLSSLRASASASLLASASSSTLAARRFLTTTSARHAVSNFAMPAMSPTMTSGGVGAWKVKEGESFSAGDVLLEIETDKATMDVEAQDDGVLAKILVAEGAKDVQVGKIIALLAEEGDDLSNLEAPKEQESQPQQQQQTSTTESQRHGQEAKSSPPPTTQAGASHGSHGSHSFNGPIFPSVQRLIVENHIQDAQSKIKGTGIRGMITKGDVLAYLGKAQSPTGTFKQPKGGIAVLGPSQANSKGSAAGAKPAAGAAATAKPNEPLSGAELRSLILRGLAASAKAPKKQSEPVAPPKKIVTRKDGIRSDDVLWSLI